MADPIVEVIILDFKVEADLAMVGVEEDSLRDLLAKSMANMAIWLWIIGTGLIDNLVILVLKVCNMVRDQMLISH